MKFLEKQKNIKQSKDIKNKIHKTSIGGQAVIEGVMMRGPHTIATAVRKPDGEIIIDKQEIGKIRKSEFLKLPIIRGCVGFFDSMVLGIKSLMFSAKFFEIDEDGEPIEEEPSKFEKWLENKLGSEKAMEIAIYISVILSLFLSVGLFILLPSFITGFLKPIISRRLFLNLIEGVTRIIIFIAYLGLVSQMKDIKRVFMYHGAEHKSIHCYEKGFSLTVENVKKQTRLHPRCGTSFLLIVMVISIIIFSLISWDISVFLRLGYRLLLLPVVAGISYEIIKFAGRHDNWFTKIISMPGLWFQYITTREPDESQIEVAIASLNSVIPSDKNDDKW